MNILMVVPGAYYALDKAASGTEPAGVGLGLERLCGLACVRTQPTPPPPELYKSGDLLA